MTSRITRTASRQSRPESRADAVAHSFTKFRAGRACDGGPLFFAALAVAGCAAAGLLVAVKGSASVDAKAPSVQVALGYEAQPVDGDILLGYAPPRAAGAGEPVYLPASGLRPLATEVEFDPGEALIEDRARQGQQAGRRLLANRSPVVETGPMVSAGVGAAVIGSGREGPAMTADDREQTDSTRPRARPAPAPGPVADAAAPDGLAAPIRPQIRPDTPVQLARADVPADMPGAAPAPGAVRVAAATPPGRVAARGTGCSARLSDGIPRRPRNAPPGSAIVSQMDSVHGAQRDALIVRQLLAGNLPDFLRDLTEVTVTGRLPSGRRGEVTICVTPDYLALGSDADFIRVPMGLPAAAHVADRFGFLLPTTRMVDAIYAQAGLRLSPQPMTPGAQMSSTRYFRQHNETVEGQTRGREERMLTAGQKKDLVLTNRLRSHPGRVAIYGWHKPNGQPIQPLSTVHGEFYSDYSHGVRLVSQTAFVGGRPVALADLLADPDYAQILTGEGPIPAPERLMASLYR